MHDSKRTSCYKCNITVLKIQFVIVPQKITAFSRILDSQKQGSAYF